MVIRWTPGGEGTVHPHVRGDNVRSRQRSGCRFGSPPRGGDNGWGYLSECWSIGSPPREWGQYTRKQATKIVPRFTPTCVGTTGKVPDIGEHNIGSPPCAWGQRFFIPVYLDMYLSKSAIGQSPTLRSANLTRADGQQAKAIRLGRTDAGGQRIKEPLGVRHAQDPLEVHTEVGL